MNWQPITGVREKATTTEDRWMQTQQLQLQNLVMLANDTARYMPEYRANPTSGIGAKFTGLNTSVLRQQLMNSTEVQSALLAADSSNPVALQLSHPDKLSLITTTQQAEIPLSSDTKVFARELLNRLYMPKGSDMMMIRAAWSFRSVLLPIPLRTPSE